MTTNHWIRRLILVALVGIGLTVGTLIAIRLYAASFDFIYPRPKQITVSRTVQPQNFWTVGSGGRITVTIMITNHEAVALRGFYYSDQIPTGWTVNTVQVQVDGSTFTNYSYTTGAAGEIYSGNTPQRWALELPQGNGNFSPTHPIPANGGTARLVYTMRVNSGTGDDYELGREGWAGWLASNPGVAVFGYQGITQTLQAAFSASPYTGTAPLTVQFTNLSTGSPSQWRWDFGDGAISAIQHPTHSYALPKTYTVTLTVTRTSTGEPSTVVKHNAITVTYPPLQADFTAVPRFGLAPLLVQFTDQSTGGIISRRWDFGDGSTSTALNPSHTYTALGYYTVTLTVTDTYRSHIAIRPRYIHAVPIIYWTYLPLVLRNN